MKLYRTADGEWVGTQAEAHNKNVIEVPVDKPGLLEWLNANARSDHSIPDHPVDSREHNDSRRADRAVASLKADEIADWLMTAPTGKVADVFVALADRYQDLNRKAEAGGHGVNLAEMSDEEIRARLLGRGGDK